jgi:hypothetical protein
MMSPAPQRANSMLSIGCDTGKRPCASRRDRAPRKISSGTTASPGVRLASPGERRPHCAQMVQHSVTSLLSSREQANSLIENVRRHRQYFSAITARLIGQFLNRYRTVSDAVRAHSTTARIVILQMGVTRIRKPETVFACSCMTHA